MSKLEGKMAKAKTKAKAKVAAKTGKTVGKKGKVACAMLAFVCAAILAGCATTGEQPARSQTQTNKFDDCLFIVGAAKTTVSNGVVVAEAEVSPAAVELFTQTQANEGSETISPTASPTTDVKPDIDLNYNDAGGAAAGAAKSAAATAAAKSSGTWNSLAKEALAATTAATAAAAKTDASGAPANLKAKITEFFADREGDVSKARMYYDADGVLTMTDGTTTVECYPDGDCRECGDKS